MQKRFAGLLLLTAFVGASFLFGSSGLQGGNYFLDAGYWAVQLWYIRSFHKNNIKTKSILAGLCSFIALMASLLFLAGQPVPGAWEVWRTISGFLLVVLLFSDLDDDDDGGNFVDDELDKIMGNEEQSTEPVAVSHV